MLAQRDEADVGFPQSLEGLEGDAAIAREAVELVHDDNIDQAGLGVRQHLLKSRSLGQIIGARTPAFIPIHLSNGPALCVTVIPASPILGIKAVSVDDLLLTRDP